VTTSARLLSLSAAGLVALCGAAGPAAAHEPPAKPRAAHPVPTVAPTGEPDPHATTGVQSLRELTAGNRTTLVGTVTRSESFDDGKLVVHRVAVERTLQGPPATESLAIVDIRAGLERPPLLVDQQRAVLVVEPAPAYSYLRQTLPAESALQQLAGGRDGVVPVASDADVEAVIGVLQASARLQAATDPAVRAAELRQLAFALLGAQSPRLVADGLIELRRLPRTLALGSEELETMRRALRRVDLPAPTRIGLIRLVGQRDWQGGLAALDAVDADRADVLDALLAARAALGAPPSRADLTPYLASEDPAVQAAAVRALARLDDPAALAEAGRWATASDHDPAVREAAIAALGESKRPEAAPFLRQTFGSSDTRLQQASARALLELPEATGTATLSELALRGDTPETRRYAALTLVLTRGKGSPAVQQLLARNPDADVRYVLEHGFDLRHVHHHE
jgi:hypothetical protein